MLGMFLGWVAGITLTIILSFSDTVTDNTSGFAVGFVLTALGMVLGYMVFNN